MVAKHEKQIRANKEDHISEVKQLDQLRAKTEKKNLNNGKLEKEEFVRQINDKDGEMQKAFDNF
jgi:hypothetical protein